MAVFTVDELDRSWRHMLAVAHLDDVPDVLLYGDLDDAWPQVREELMVRLEVDYEPRPPLVLEVAKNSYTSRPITLLDPTDRVVYEALVASIAVQLDDAIGPEVYSARIDRSRPQRLTSHGVKAWRAFQRRGIQLRSEYEFSYMLTSDVTSFYEYIDVRQLASNLRSIGVDSAKVDLLEGLLARWHAGSDVWGLPQGSDASSILAGFYLVSLDEVFRGHGLRFCRYGDDFFVFSNDDVELRTALRDAVIVLRSLHLNLSTHKTDIIEGEWIDEFFEDQEKSAIQYQISLPPEWVDDEELRVRLRGLFQLAVEVDPIRDRDIRFCVYRLQRLGDPYAVPWILENLVSVPYLANYLIPYLSEMSQRFPELDIELRVRRFLEDRRLNIYPVLEMSLIRMLSRLPVLDSQTLRRIWMLVEDANRVRPTRAYAARCIGRHARAGDGARLLRVMRGSDSTMVRRGALVGAWETGVMSVKDLDLVSASDESLAPTCRYLARGSQVPAL